VSMPRWRVRPSWSLNFREHQPRENATRRCGTNRGRPPDCEGRSGARHQWSTSSVPLRGVPLSRSNKHLGHAFDVPVGDARRLLTQTRFPQGARGERGAHKLVRSADESTERQAGPSCNRGSQRALLPTCPRHCTRFRSPGQTAIRSGSPPLSDCAWVRLEVSPSYSAGLGSS
jgi:hypothetical protein